VGEESRDAALIRTPDRRLRVFVSSTLGELAEERRAVSRAISALRLTPVMFELGARPYPPREVYQQYLAQSDVFIGLYWQRYGQLVPGAQVSGLEEEFELSGKLPRLLYVKTPASDREPGLADLLARIEHDASASYRHFRTPAELGRLVRDDLAVLLSERFAAGGHPAAAAAPPSPGRSRGPRPLPVGTTSLIGREQAIGEVAGLLGEPRVRLVTLTGPGGIGKTRLAVAAGERLRGRFGSGVVFVPMAAITDPGLVLADIARASGADLAGTGSPLEALAERFADGAWLLIVDNLEQVVQAGRDLAELLARCPQLVVLATSRTALGLAAEREYPVPPLPLPASAPPGAAGVYLAEVAASPAVALFVDRARAVRPGFALTKRNAAAVAEICRRLEGMPLAIELAAARTRLLDPGTLLRRLAASLDALGTGAVDLPERQLTLRATVEWSVGLLPDAERSLLETVAVFVDGWTLEAAAQVADLTEDRALELSEGLARHSLIYLDASAPDPRSRMLETIRVFVAERLAARADAAKIEGRHAGYYRALAEQADRPLRGAGQGEWLEQLEAEAGNLAAAVRWYLAHDPALLPRVFRVLWPFWFLRDHINEARVWVDELLPAAPVLGPPARAELEWAAMVTANEVGDDAGALAARQRLEALLDTVDDPFMHAVCQLALAWTAPITGDFDGALRAAAASLQQFRAQDEPFWTAQADAALGGAETAVGRYDDALRHLHEMSDIAERFGYAWLAAWSRTQLGTVAVLQARLDHARELLDEALDLSLAIRVSRNVALCLVAFARLALAEGNPERAALAAGAADGLRQRAGLRAWPILRRGEADVAAQIRQVLGAERFDQVFASGSGLSQREAAAAVRGRPDPGTQSS
jgi:predicted ATPase